MTNFNTFDELYILLPHDVKLKLEGLKTLRENPQWHSESSCYEHIKIVVTRLIKTGDIDLVLAGLFHDLGKLQCAKLNPKTGYPSTIGHENIGGELVFENRSFIKTLGGNVDTVYDIVKNHMRIQQYDNMRPHKKHEMEGLSVYKKLLIFTKADDMLNEFIW